MLGDRQALGPWRLLAVALLVGVAVRLPGMTESLWFDETWRTTSRLNADLAFATLFRDVHNFLYNAFMYGWIRLFGQSEVSIRLPSMLAGVGAAWLFADWVSRRFGRRLGWFVLLWALVAPAHVWYSAEAKNNAFTLFFSCLAFVAIERSARQTDRCALWCAATAIALALCVDYTALLLIVPALLCVAWSGQGRRAVQTCALGLLLCSPMWIDRLLHPDGMSRSYARNFDLGEMFLLLVNYFPTGNALAPYRPFTPGAAFEDGRGWLFAPLGLLLVALLCAGGVAMRAARRGAGMWLLAPLFAPLAMVLVASAVLHALWPGQGRYIYQERNLLTLLLPFAALLGAGVLSLRSKSLRVGALCAVFGVPLASDIAMLGPHDDRWTVYKPNPDWRGAAAWLRAQPEARQGRLVALESAKADALSYYLPDVVRISRPWPPNPEELLATFARYDVDTIFVLRNQHWLPPDRRLFPAGHGVTLEDGFEGRAVKVWRLRRSR